MQRSPRFALVAATLICGLFGITVGAPGALAQRTSSADSAQSRLTQALLDTIVARLSALELQQAELAVGRSAESHERLEVQRRIAILREYLAEMPDPSAAQAAATERVLRVIDARLAGVAVDRRLLAVERNGESAHAQALAALEGALRRRRAELRALLLGTSGG